MKDYSLNEKQREMFIVDMIIMDDNTLSVIFADGSRMDHIAYTKENVEKIKEVLEEQATEGVSKLSQFRKKAGLASAGFCASLAGFTALGLYLSSNYFGDDPVKFIACTGAVMVAGVLPSVVHTCKTSGKLEELQKLYYRDEHRRELDAVGEYPNALNGVKHKKHFKHWLAKQEDPYSALFVDCYTTDDLEKIVSNVEKEREFEFDYPHKKTK